MAKPQYSGKHQTNRKRLLEQLTPGSACPMCGRPMWNDRQYGWLGVLALDHTIPVALGGTGDLSNLRLVHRRCNSAAGARLKNSFATIQDVRRRPIRSRIW